MQPFEVEALLDKYDGEGKHDDQDEAYIAEGNDGDGRVAANSWPPFRKSLTSRWLAVTFILVLAAVGVICKHSNDSNGSYVSQVLNETERRQAAYDLAMNRFRDRTAGHHTYSSIHELHPRRRYLLNSIRIPKAGSSHLSMVARALVGCRPDGYPCCRGPTRACPRGDLQCPTVIGCVDHRPKYHLARTPLVTALRHPTSRLLSGFFYTPPHRPIPKDDYSWTMFEYYSQAPEYRNVMTKMFSTGDFAYRPFQPGNHTLVRAQMRLGQFQWFGINELPILSALLLYESKPFTRLQPNRVVFGLEAIGDAYAPSQRSQTDDGMRVHSNDPEYAAFLATTFPDNNGSALIEQYNQEDMTLYDWALRLFCGRIQGAGLWEPAKSFIPDEVEKCWQTLVKQR